MEQHSDNGMNNSPSEDFNPSIPHVLACGYREIQSPKSGLTFPTFLVALPYNDHQPPKSCSVWRSKRDFLQLGRALQQEHMLPKAAMKKLAERVPWKRPGVVVETSNESEQHNNFHPSMKKSVLQLDQFLQAAHAQFAAAATTTTNQNETIMESWQWFSRPKDTEGLVPLDANTMVETGNRHYANGSNSAVATIKSSQLGQYFCTHENAILVVCAALNNVGSQILGNESVPLVFLEPSCGHGDIVDALVDQLREHNISPNRVTIHACDIDSDAIAVCQKKILSCRDYKVNWVCQNFLKTPRAVAADLKGAMTICLGGPPYSAGAGSSASINGMQWDLPTRFVQHCLEEWKASIIAFLMPDRYRDTRIILGSGVTCKTIELRSSTFFFQGRTAVTQPSILQCYIRQSRDGLATSVSLK